MNRYINAIKWRANKLYNLIILYEKIRNKKIKKLKLHIGCGSQYLSDYINVDIKFTKTVDLITDLNYPKIFKDQSISIVFSNAFFEHLFRNKRLNHLKLFYKSLDDDGIMCYIGIPYFLQIADLYLKNDFDLFKVYRYTHGDPERDGSERTDSWLEQLHKSLFDENEILKLLLDAGFTKFLIFKYCFPGEPGFKVNMGFYAVKNSKITNIENECNNFLKKFDNEKILLDTLEFI